MIETTVLGVLSTAHVTKESAEWLDAQGLMAATKTDSPVVNIGSTEYGWIIWCPRGDEYGADVIDPSVPSDVKDVLFYARENGCVYVYLDRDAMIAPDLPSYNW